MNAHRVQPFRKYDRMPASNWRLVPWIALGLFDVALIGYVLTKLWSFSRFTVTLIGVAAGLLVGGWLVSLVIRWLTGDGKNGY